MGRGGGYGPIRRIARGPASVTARPGAVGPRSRRCPRQRKTGRTAGVDGSFRSQAPVAPAEAMSVVAEERPPDAVRAVERRHAVGRGGVVPPERDPTVVRARCQRGTALGDLSPLPPSSRNATSRGTASSVPTPST